MYQLSACVELLFCERGATHADRIRAAAAAGIPAVEFWFWGDNDTDAIRAALDDTGMAVTALAAEPWGAMVDPARRREVLDGIDAACRVACVIGAPTVVVVAGDDLPYLNHEQQRASVIATLRAAAPIAAEHGVELLLEPLNTVVDHPGHFLHSTAEGLRIVRDVDAPNVRLLYDLYHSLMMGEEPERVLTNQTPLIGHMQIADIPGRGEPGTGSLDWHAQLSTLRAVGYRGRIGLEYLPRADTVTSLRHVHDVLAQIGSREVPNDRADRRS